MVLGTFDFQARPLYEKHGYTVCGTIEDWSKGHCNSSLMKWLDRPSREYVPSDGSERKKYEVKQATKEDGERIRKGLGDYNESQVPGLRQEEGIHKKITDDEGNLIAGIFAKIGDWNDLFVELWVEEPYRNKGIGSYLLREAELEAKEKGAYFVLTSSFGTLDG